MTIVWPVMVSAHDDRHVGAAVLVAVFFRSDGEVRPIALRCQMAAERRLAMALFAIVRYHLGNRAAIGKKMAILRRAFEITAQWDDEAGVWWCSNDELPLTTEAPTFEQLVARVLEIAPEIAAENGLAAPGDEIELHIVAERVQSVPVVAAA
jgi:hypothetical protein